MRIAVRRAFFVFGGVKMESSTISNRVLWSAKEPGSAIMSRILWSAKDLQQGVGLSRTMAYQLLHNPACPVVVIGSRRFMDAEKFREWLTQQNEK